RATRAPHARRSGARPAQTHCRQHGAVARGGAVSVRRCARGTVAAMGVRARVLWRRRGTEQPQVVRELREWSARYRQLVQQVGAEMRWIPELDDLRNWIAEYRVSLCAQELKTLGPVSAARLELRAAEVEAWIVR